MNTTPQQGLARLFILLFLGYLGAVLAFHRDFARLSLIVGGLPLFTGEVALMGLCTGQVALAWQQRGIKYRFNLVDTLVFIYIAIGCTYALVGFARGFGLATVRDFALVYYAAFYFLTRMYLTQAGKISWFVTTLTIGGIVAAIVASSKFLIAPTMGDGHGTSGWVALSSWIAVLALLGGTPPQTLITKAGRFAALAICGFAVYLSAYRTMAMVVMAGLSTLGVAWWRTRRRDLRDLLIRASTWAGLLVALTSVHFGLADPPPTPARMYGSVTLSEGLRILTARWAMQPMEVREYLPLKIDGQAGTFKPGKPTLVNPGGMVTSYSFRSRAWANAWQRIRTSPFLGLGFGSAAILHSEELCRLLASPLSNCGAAHNTFLTIAMRMGIPVLGLLLAANLIALLRLARLLRSEHTGEKDFFSSSSVLGLALLSCLIYAGTSLYLESPYLSAPYWMILGGLVGSLDQNREPVMISFAC